MFKIMKLSLLVISLLLTIQVNGQISSDNWSYVEIDSTRQKWGDWNKPNWLRYFGFDAKDITADGFKDIVSGRYFYRNPGGDMSSEWVRTDLGMNVDGMLFTDVDGDKYGDVIAQALPNIYWLEADDLLGSSWKANKVAEIPKTKHVNGQGYHTAQIIAGGKPELVFTTLKGVYYIIIPDEKFDAPWDTVRVTGKIMDEGVGIGDINKDGTLDVVVGKELKRKEVFGLYWYSNPGDGSGNWSSIEISKDVEVPDRIVVADINGDNLADVIVSEERFPGKEPNANLSWYQNPGDGTGNWEKHIIFTGYSLNNMDVADVDNDGDMDVSTNELIKSQKLLVFENDGKGKFTEHLIDSGKDMHLGARFYDLDNDGDIDIVGHSWNGYKKLHMWRNDALKNPAAVKWSHISTQTHLRDFPTSNVGWQSSAIVFDIDKDGTDNIVIAGWSDPDMIWYKKIEKGFERYVIDDKKSHIEAGGTYWDIDDDGDLDILQGGSWATNEVWWWENPYPNFEPNTPWERYTIKNYGKKQHHDQIFGDFDGDGTTELVFWNQKAKILWIADIPEDPKEMENWKLEELWSWPKTFKYEGFAKADVDQDGIVDLIGGGHWFKFLGEGKYEANKIDDYGMSRSVVGDFIKGGRPEIVLGSGDGVGPLNLYEWNGTAWIKTTLIETVDHGHTLQVGDINGDGNLDIYTAEMKDPGAGEIAKQYVLYGDGKGNFTIQIVSIGIGTHEGKLGDLDGDGDLDILQKDFRNQKRVDVWWNEGGE